MGKYIECANNIRSNYDNNAFPLIDKLYYNLDDLVKELKSCTGTLFEEAITDLVSCQTNLSVLKDTALENLDSITNNARTYDSLRNKYSNTKINSNGLIEYTHKKEITTGLYENVTEVIPDMEKFKGGSYN
mgnify:FL=1